MFVKEIVLVVSIVCIMSSGVDAVENDIRIRFQFG